MVKNLLLWLTVGTLLFVVSWYLDYPIIFIAGAIGFGANVLYQDFRNKILETKF
jgi:hypothetical protein